MMRVEDGEREYLSWIARTIMVTEGSPYFRVISQMHATAFNPLVSGDVNRFEDGKSIRRDFLFDIPAAKHLVAENFHTRDCTFLEMVVGVSARMGHMIDKTTASCFWHIMANLGLDGDAPHPARVDEAMYVVNNRTFDPSGKPGMFPLDNPAKDQKEEEILQQMYAYVLENELH